MKFHLWQLQEDSDKSNAFPERLISSAFEIYFCFLKYHYYYYYYFFLVNLWELNMYFYNYIYQVTELFLSNILFPFTLTDSICAFFIRMKRIHVKRVHFVCWEGRANSFGFEENVWKWFVYHLSTKSEEKIVPGGTHRVAPRVAALLSINSEPARRFARDVHWNAKHRGDDNEGREGGGGGKRDARTDDLAVAAARFIPSAIRVNQGSSSRGAGTRAQQLIARS